MAQRWSLRRMVPARVFLFLHILGPGIIAANADNDASGIFGYSQAGAQYQYGMLWVLVISTIALGVAQEMCARMGAITGKGLADLIREEYGIKITVFAMTALLVANLATTVSEFAGILFALRVYFHEYARWIVVPLVAAGIWFVVTRGTYRRLEQILLLASSVYLLYIISAVKSYPNWGQVAHETFFPNFHAINPLKDYVFMIINVVGTTITPWGQFYIQSIVRDKGIEEKDYKFTKIDVLFGAFFTNFIAFFIIVCCGATLYRAGIHDLQDAGQIATALLPLAGSFATGLFVVGLFNACCFGAIAVPLSTAYAVTEALGWEGGIGRRTKEAPLFMGVFTFLIATGALIVVLAPKYLTALIILPNIVGAVLLPIILILMLRLVNKRRLMGDYINTPTFNLIAWTTTVVLIVLSAILFITSFFPHAFDRLIPG